MIKDFEKFPRAENSPGRDISNTDKDEPMKCLSLYRRALQTGKPCPSLYNNLALASIATGQVDVAFRCFSKALQELSSDEEAEQIWYNIGNTCILIGEHQLAQQG